MIETRKFETLTVLTAMSDRLLTVPDKPEDGNGIGKLYALLEFMTGESPFTHQLPRFCEECKPSLQEQFPKLHAVVPEIVSRCEAGQVESLRVDLVDLFGRFVDVEKPYRLPHQRKNPVAELVDMKYGGSSK